MRNSHQVCGIIKPMEIDQPVKMIDARQHVNDRSLADGGMIDPTQHGHPFCHNPLDCAESVLKWIGFPTSKSLFQSREEREGQLRVEDLISDALFPCAKSNLSPTSEKQHRSLHKEL
jgi:hypothetical protein